MKGTIKKLISKGKTFREEQPQKFKLIFWSSFVTLAGVYILAAIAFAFFSSPECTGIPRSPITFVQILDALKKVAIICITIPIIGTISASISYYKASKTFKRSSGLWQTAEDELLAIKEFDHKKDLCFVKLFWAWWFATFVSTLCILCSVIMAIRPHGVELLSESSLNALYQGYVGTCVLFVAYIAFFVYLQAFTAQTLNSENYEDVEERLKRLKKRLFGTKGGDKDVL